MKCLVLVIEFLILFELFGNVLLKTASVCGRKAVFFIFHGAQTKYQRVPRNMHCSE